MSVCSCLCVSPFWFLPPAVRVKRVAETQDRRVSACSCLCVSPFWGFSLPAESGACGRDTGLVCLYVGVCVSHLSVFFPAGRGRSVLPRHRIDVCLYVDRCVSHLSCSSCQQTVEYVAETQDRCVSVCSCVCLTFFALHSCTRWRESR